MSIEYFIAKRIHFRQDKKNVSRPAVRIATIAIALGMAVMLISLAVVVGFKSEVRNKAIGFGGHIQISSVESVGNYEMQPIVPSDAFLKKISALPDVKSLQRFVTKPGIIKTDEDFQGILLKGIAAGANNDFFRSHLVEGEIPAFEADTLTNGVLISSYLAAKLKLGTGDSFFSYTYTSNEQMRARKFRIQGIYNTSFVEYDKMFILADIRHLQQLNGWKNSQVSGVEIQLTDFDSLEPLSDLIYQLVMQENTDGDKRYYAQTIRDMNPQIFGWLDLIDMNVWVILLLMLAVAGFNMISGLLILILERTNMIGILKSLGATNWSVRKIFLYHSVFLIARGMFWGNLIGLAFCVIQYYTHLIPLDPESYYVAYVPVVINWLHVVLLNVGTFVLSVLMMVGPSYLITKISPAKIIRYE